MHRSPWRSVGPFAGFLAKQRTPRSALFWVLASVIPLVTILSTHIWLRTAYTGDLFHLQGFLGQYDYGIYRYRLLGRDTLLFLYQFLISRFHDQPLVMPRDPNATLLFYGSYVALNAVCFAVSNFLLLLFLSDGERHIGDLQLATYLYLTLIQTYAMAVVTPYDQLAYLLILISFLAVTISRDWISYGVLGIVAIAGTLNRETQFIVTPALVSIALFSTGRRSRRFWIAGACNLAVFGLVYVALRAVLPGAGMIAGGTTYGGKSALVGSVVLALLFFISTTMAFRTHPDIRPTLALLVLSTPYIVSILISGALRELRLLVPILLAQVFVYKELRADPGQADNPPAPLILERLKVGIGESR